MDLVVSEENPAEEQVLMSAEKGVLASHAALRDAFAGILGLRKDVVIALVTPECLQRVKRADNRLKSMLQDLVNRMLDEILNQADLVDCLLRKSEEAAQPRRQVKKATKAICKY